MNTDVVSEESAEASAEASGTGYLSDSHSTVDAKKTRVTRPGAELIMSTQQPKRSKRRSRRRRRSGSRRWRESIRKCARTSREQMVEQIDHRGSGSGKSTIERYHPVRIRRQKSRNRQRERTVRNIPLHGVSRRYRSVP